MELEKLLKKLKRSARKFVKKTVEVSNDAIDFGKCKIKISSLNGKIEDNYYKIGEAVYMQSLSEDEADSTQIEAWCDEITTWNEEIDDLKQMIKKDSENE